MTRVELLDRIVRGEDVGEIVVVAAHPDDETLWAGALLANRRCVTLVHLTDGAPRDLWFARQAGCETREEYVQLRAEELSSALAILGLSKARRLMLGACDQEAATQLVALTTALGSELRKLAPRAVLTHAYDGGHPDHDAAAFIVRAALRIASTDAVLLEFGGYHASRAGSDFEIGFLPPERHVESVERILSVQERHEKARALQCFDSQREVIMRLDVGREFLRPGGPENFGAPPHVGQLYYERHGWPINGSVFREEVRRAARVLDVPMVLG